MDFIVTTIKGVVSIPATRFLVLEPRGEDLELEDQRFRAYLVVNGWEGDRVGMVLWLRLVMVYWLARKL